MTIGTRISTLRKSHSFTQEYLAERLGVSRQAVYKWEQDQSAPDTANLIALAALLGVTVEYLATGTDPAPSPTPPQPSTQRIVGFLLLGAGLFSGILGILLNELLLLLGIFLIAAAVLALAVRKHFALISGWTFWGLCTIVLAVTARALPIPFLALLSHLIVGDTGAAVATWNVILSLIQMLTLILLIVWTILTVRQSRKE